MFKFRVLWLLGFLVWPAHAQIQPGDLPVPKTYTPPQQVAPTKTGVQPAPVKPAAKQPAVSKPLPLTLVPDKDVAPQAVPGKPKVRNLTTQDLVLAADGAGTQIVMYVRYLRNGALAEAIRLGIRERGIQVYIITPVENLRDPGSYFLSLVANGAKVYALNVPRWKQSKSFMVVDQSTLITGNLLGELPTLTNPQVTHFTQKKSTVAEYFNWFGSSIQNRSPFYPKEGWIKYFGLGTH